MDWDLSDYFSGMDGADFSNFKASLEADLQQLQAQIDHLPHSFPQGLQAWLDVLRDWESWTSRHGHLRSYISCLCAADARNDAYLAEESSLAELAAKAAPLQESLLVQTGALEEAGFAYLANQSGLLESGDRLRQWRRDARQRMAPELEALNAQLAVQGISAWSRLYFTHTGNLQFRYLDPQQGELEVPFSHYNSLLSNPSRERRHAAFAGAASALQAHQQTFAAALNAISGTRLTLNRRRGIDDFLTPSLRQSRLSRASLEAMLEAIESSLPFAREVFRFRSAQMGISDPGYADLRAPLQLDGMLKAPSWQQACEWVSCAFHQLYPAMGSYFDEMVNKRHIDYSPRSGKRPGGFCTGSMLLRQSRIFMTYRDTLNDVLTLAHEVGHAWHSRLLRTVRPLCASYPMTLAESASTFAERVLTHGILADAQADPGVQLALLDAEIEHLLAFLLDLPVRFHFEHELYRRRAKGTLSPSEICALMQHIQQRIFGDSLAAGGEDPWFWASKLHFYIHEVEFYNYPYTFGYLLSSRLFQRLKHEGSAFIPQYERFMATSGSADCETLVQRFLGEDISSVDFWLCRIRELESVFAQYKVRLLKLRG